MTSLNVAEAKARLSELLGRVAQGGETILITRQGKPMAKLVPPNFKPKRHLAEVQGWLEDDDPFFEMIESLSNERSKRTPRILENHETFDLDSDDQ